MRKTIASPAVVSGIGLHTGVPATMTFKPAESGITFLRTDIPGAKPIEALAKNVGSTLRGTNLKNETAEVCTVEHALSALHALGITDQNHPFRFHGTDGFLLVKALPQSMVNAVFQSAAARFWKSLV